MKKFLRTGVQVLDRIAHTDDEGLITKREMLVAGLGFSTRVEVSKPVYEGYASGDVAIWAYRPNACSQKLFGTDKTVKGFEPQHMGFQKLDKKGLVNFFTQEDIEVSIMSMNWEPIVINQDKIDKGEDKEERIYNYCTVGVSGLLSGTFKVSKEEYDTLKVHKNYKVKVGVGYEKGKLMLNLYDFVEAGEVEGLEGYDM